MRRIRRHLAAVFGIWLLCHTGALAFTPIAMCIALGDLAAAPQCTCNHADGTICPMHHRTTSTSKTVCSCRSTSDTDTATLSSLLGPIAVIAPVAIIQTPNRSTSVAARTIAALTHTPVVPEPPPPRL